jgi:peptide-methionine (S)-S-oxide reductase
MKKAIFAAGCFWCYEPVFMSLKGVVHTQVGYIGGTVQNPTYEQVCTGQTGHVEAIEIEFDENAISFEQLVEVFWSIHDPTSLNRQGNDIGTQYRTAIFYLDEEQRLIAEKSKIENQKNFEKPIVTEIIKAETFYKAEDYHQNFYNKNKGYGYCEYVINPKIQKFKNEFKNLLK